jgi:hypothetical protein
VKINRPWMIATLAIAACLGSSAADAATKPSVRVGPDYYGVNYPRMRVDGPAVRDRQLEAIAAAGIEQVRFALVWRDLEPEAPADGHPSYDWSASDSEVAELARHRLRLMPTFALTPGWAATGGSLDCAFGVASAGTDRIDDYANAAGALATRYGPRGTFWRQHPELPPMPITTWEIWNEPNLRQYWCPSIDPAAYAQLFVPAAEAIKASQPDARVLTGGLAIDGPAGEQMPVGEFLARALASRPDLWQVADGIGAHMYPAGETYQQLAVLATLRAEMTAAGVPKTMPIFATELGWGLIGPFDLSEQERAERYRFVTRRLPRTNCNVAMMNAHAWTTTPSGPVWDYDAGIADPDTAALFPSAIAYRDSIALMRGLTARQAPHSPDPSCPGMPRLDRDGDGRTEHRDYYPLDPKRWRGPRSWYPNRAR